MTGLRHKEVADLLGCTVNDVLRYRRKDGRFPKPTVKEGRERLFDRAAVIEWRDHVQTVSAHSPAA